MSRTIQPALTGVALELALAGGLVLAGAHAAAAQPADRYGAQAPAADAPGAYTAIPSAATAPAPLRGRMLSWPGKTALAAPPSAYGLSGYGPPAFGASAYGPSSYGQGAYSQAGYGQRGPAGSAAPGPAAGYRTASYAPAAPRPASGGYTQGAYDPRASAQVRYAPSSYASSPYAPPRYAQAEGTRESYAPAAASPPGGGAPGRSAAWSPSEMQGWRPVQAAAPGLAAAPALAGAPNGSYGRAASAPPPLRTASADRRYGYDPRQDHSVRFYSVHRPFGLQPDPAPIPPQFFANTADLSQPAGPLPEERTVAATGSGGTSRTVRAAPDTSVQ